MMEQPAFRNWSDKESSVRHVEVVGRSMSLFQETKKLLAFLASMLNRSHWRTHTSLRLV